MPGTIDADFARGLLRAQVTEKDGTLNVELHGTADTMVTRDLHVFLTDVHKEALARHASVVFVDLRDLEFMNSSCLKCFVAWLARIQDLDAAAHYRIRFLSDPTKHWQRRSLVALSSFAPVVMVDT